MTFSATISGECARLGSSIQKTLVVAFIGENEAYTDAKGDVVDFHLRLGLHHSITDPNHEQQCARFQTPDYSDYHSINLPSTQICPRLPHEPKPNKQRLKISSTFSPCICNTSVSRRRPT